MFVNVNMVRVIFTFCFSAVRTSHFGSVHGSKCCSYSKMRALIRNKECFLFGGLKDWNIVKGEIYSCKQTTRMCHGILLRLISKAKWSRKKSVHCLQEQFSLSGKICLYKVGFTIVLCKSDLLKNLFMMRIVSYA